MLYTVFVATVLTVHGIETLYYLFIWVFILYKLQQSLPFTVLKLEIALPSKWLFSGVATVLTVHGIETQHIFHHPYEYQDTLQQSLPFTVLKLSFLGHDASHCDSCNSPYRSRYWNLNVRLEMRAFSLSCNSPYRSRYWNTVHMWYANSTTWLRCNSTYRSRYWNLS